MVKDLCGSVVLLAEHFFHANVVASTPQKRYLLQKSGKLFLLVYVETIH